MMRFAQPWLLAFGVPLVLFVLFRLRSLPASLSGGRRRFVQACLALGAIAGLMAAAGLELGHPVDVESALYPLFALALLLVCALEVAWATRKGAA